MNFKQALAPRNQVLSLVVLSFFCLLFLVMLVFLVYENPNLAWIFGLVIPLILILLKWKNDRTFNLYFDSEFLYLENKQDQKRILLNQISTAKSLSNRIKVFGFDYQQYVIEYRNEKGAIKMIHCWVSTFDSSWSDFRAYLAK